MKTLIECAVKYLSLQENEVIRNIESMGGIYIDHLHNQIGDCFELSLA